MVWKISDINTLRINHEVQPSFTSDSRFVFIASGTEVKLYNMTSGEPVRTLKHIAVVTGICASLTNPTEVYTTSLDGILTVWNYEDGIELVKHNMGEPIIRMKGDQEANTMVVVLKGPASKYFNMRFLDSTKLNKKDEELQFPTYQFSDLGNLSSIDISGSCVAVAARKNLIIWEPSQNIQLRWPSNLIVPNTGRRRRVDLLTVAINPVDDCFLAVGDSLGNIHYLRREQQHRHYISNLQWHSFGTTALKFFMDGTGFLSGGQEGTLLSWELKTYTFKKMGTVGTITQIAISPNDQYAAFTTTENALVTLEISLLRSKSLVEGYKSEHYKTLPSDWLRSPCMKVEPQHGYIALNGAKGYIQFYDVQTDRIVNSFEVVPPNLSAFSGHAGRQELPNPHIDHFAFSSQGTGLALAVYRKVMLKNQHKFLENSLRFYWYSDVDETWLLETRVELPHGDRITNVAYHPQKDIVVSCGEDGRFRVWNRTLIKDKEGSTKVQHGRWVCRSVGNYKTNACSSCAFSPDGSLLAVGYDNMLTLWNPITNILLSEIYHPDCNFIKHILFIADSPYVVTTTQDKLFVWNVLDSSLVWSCEANVFAIAAHPKDPTFAVSVTTLSRKIPSTITQAKDELMKKRRSYVVLFSASSPKPLFTWKVSQDKTPVAMAIGRKDHLKQTGWIILCTTAKQRSFIIEDLSSQTDEEKTEELASLKSEKKLGYLETVMGTDMDEDEEVSARVDSVKHRLMFRRRDQFLSTLAETPSHVLPPMTELFRSYMENVIPKDPNLIEKTEQTQETNEKEKETAATPTVPKKKLEQSQAPTEIPSDSRHLPKQVMELVQLFQGQLVLTDQSADAHPNAGLTSSGKKRNETTQKEASNPLSLSRSASKDLKKKKVDEMQEEPLTNGTTEHKEESVTVGVKRTSEDRIIQGSKKESNGSHSQENEESEGTPKSGRKQALRTSQTKSAPTTPASQPKNQKQNNQTPKSALRQSGSKQKQ